MSKQTHITGKQLQAITDERLASFSDFIDYLDTLQPNATKDALIEYFEEEIKFVGGNENVLRMYFTKDRAVNLLKWEDAQ